MQQGAEFAAVVTAATEAAAVSRVISTVLEDCVENEKESDTGAAGASISSTGCPSTPVPVEKSNVEKSNAQIDTVKKGKTRAKKSNGCKGNGGLRKGVHTVMGHNRSEAALGQPEPHQHAICASAPGVNMPDLSESLVEALKSGAGCENYCIKDEDMKRNGTAPSHSGVPVENIVDLKKACKSRSEPVGIVPPSQDKEVGRKFKTSCRTMPGGDSAVSRFEDEAHDSVGSSILNCSPETCEPASAASLQAEQAEPAAGGQVPGDVMLFTSVAGQNSPINTQSAPADCKTGSCNLVAASQQHYRCVEQYNLDSFQLPFSNTESGLSQSQNNITRLSAGQSATTSIPVESQNDPGSLLVTQRGQGSCQPLWQRAPRMKTTQNSRQSSDMLILKTTLQ